MKKIIRLASALTVAVMLALLAVSCTGKGGELDDISEREDAEVGSTESDATSETVVENGRDIEVSRPDIEYDAEYVIRRPITDADNAQCYQGLEKSERRATEASKYNFDMNPLINPDKQPNTACLPSFDIDGTGFVRAGTGISQLSDKTLAFFTADSFAAWSYRNSKGQTVDEWEWFKELKKELGLNIKYTVKQKSTSVEAALQAMNSGMQCDLVYANHVVFPSSLCISRDITGMININNLGSSPGVCKTTMDLCKWGNTLRIISPIGCVDVLWYNRTLTQQLGLSDPHLMWENGVWNWNTFSDFLSSAPATNGTGEALCAFVEWPRNSAYAWPSTNGSVYLKLDAENAYPAIVNGWEKPQTLEAWEFIANVHNSVRFGGDGTGSGFEKSHLGLYEGTTLMSATMYTQVYRDTEYSKTARLDWVPYPKSGAPCSDDICQLYGYGMLLPKKTANEDNVGIALKFAELWATRFTEAIFDNLGVFEYYSFNYTQRKQYFDFVTKNVVFALSMNDFSNSEIDSNTNFFKAFYGTSEYNIRTEAAKAANYVNEYIIECMKFGR